MKFRLLFIFLVSFSGNLFSQEFQTWNAADFEIDIKALNPELDEFDFGLDKSDFNLPSGRFLNVEKQKGIDMLALIEQENNYRQRTVDIGSPLPKRNNDKKGIEVNTEFGPYNRTGVQNDALNSNPFYRNQRYYQQSLQNTVRRRMYGYGRGYYISPYRRYY